MAWHHHACFSSTSVIIVRYICQQGNAVTASWHQALVVGTPMDVLRQLKCHALCSVPRLYELGAWQGPCVVDAMCTRCRAVPAERRTAAAVQRGRQRRWSSPLPPAQRQPPLVSRPVSRCNQCFPARPAHKSVSHFPPIKVKQWPQPCIVGCPTACLGLAVQSVSVLAQRGVRPTHRHHVGPVQVVQLGLQLLDLCPRQLLN